MKILIFTVITFSRHASNSMGGGMKFLRRHLCDERYAKIRGVNESIV